MSKGVTKDSVSRVVIRSKDSILKWVEETSGKVYVPEGRPCRDGYIYSGVLDRSTGKRLDKNKVVSTLGDYLTLLEKHDRKYEYYQIFCNDEFYLVPSHGYTLAKFCKVHYPIEYARMGCPSKVQFNKRKWDFRVWSKTDHLTKQRKFFDIPNEISKILIGPKGCVTNDFHSKTNCSFTVKFNHKTRTSYIILYADESLMDDATKVISSMISSAMTDGVVSEIPKII